MLKGWWYYSAPVGTFKDMSNEELATNGFPGSIENGEDNKSGGGSSSNGSGSTDPSETKKDK